MTKFPTFMFHKVDAPEGKLFASAEELEGLGPGWVDTPAAFDPKYAPPPPAPETTDVPEDARQRGFVPVAYPSYRYRKGEPGSARLVANFEEDEVLQKAEPGVWKETHDPAAWAPKKPANGSSGGPRSVPPPPNVPPPNVPDPVTLSEDQKLEFLTTPVGTLAEVVETLSTVAAVDAFIAVETESDKPRATVVKALKARRAVIAAGE